MSPLPKRKFQHLTNFREDPFRQLAMRSRGFLGTYLIALAGLQKGLHVTFLYDAESVKSADRTNTEVQVGRNFALSDGKKVYRFSSSSGQFTSRFASNITRRKDSQKELFRREGIPVPAGYLSNKNSAEDHLEKINAETKAARFVIKPFDGSLARDTYVNLSSDEIIERVKDFPFDEFMIEEFVTGPEYRFTVVDGKCVGIFERRSPHVVGDGVKSVEKLIAEKNVDRNQNPFLVNKDITTNYMTTTEKDFVPALDEVFKISDLQRVGAGGDPWDVTDELPDIYKNIAVKVTSAIQARNAGIDMIIGDVNDPRSAKVLEANVRHHIEGHSFCVNKTIWDNHVAESIVEMYFPETRNIKSECLPVYDHSKVLMALQTQAFSALHLPRFEPDWISWNFIFGDSDVHSQLKNYILPIVGQCGLHCCVIPLDRGKQCVNISGPAAPYEHFLDKTNLIEALKLSDEVADLDFNSA